MGKRKFKYIVVDSMISLIVDSNDLSCKDILGRL